MLSVQKTVFISYRRADWTSALAVFHDLTHHGFDVFIDYDGLSSGDFEKALLENIGARAHFLVVLTPTALDRCSEPDDWLRREIKEAIRSQRNIVPLLFPGFDFKSPGVANKLTDSLSSLSRYNAVVVVPQYFPAAMELLRKFLTKPLNAVLHAPSYKSLDIAKAQHDAAAASPPVSSSVLVRIYSDNAPYRKEWESRKPLETVEKQAESTDAKPIKEQQTVVAVTPLPPLLQKPLLSWATVTKPPSLSPQASIPESSPAPDVEPASKPTANSQTKPRWKDYAFVFSVMATYLGILVAAAYLLLNVILPWLFGWG